MKGLLRYFSSLTWKVPSLSIGVVAAVVGISSHFIDNITIGGIIMLFRALVLLAVTFITAKYRLFEEARAEFLKELEEDFRNGNSLIKEMPVETIETLRYREQRQKYRESLREKAKEEPPKMKGLEHLYYRKAFHVLLVLLFGFIALFIFLSIVFILHDEAHIKNLATIIIESTNMSKTETQLPHINGLL